jgi:transcriptional regulator with XRE-family HTH domain
MKSFGPILQSLRLSKGLVVRELAAKSGIDPALISKFETGKRFPNEDHIRVLARALEVPFAELKKKWKVEQVMYLIVEEEDALEILHLAKSRTEYLLSERH